MIKIIEAHYLKDFQVTLKFSDGKEGHFDGHALLQHNGPLLEPLRAEPYFRRLFIDAGALCWPNGLGLSLVMFHETCRALEMT